MKYFFIGLLLTLSSALSWAQSSVYIYGRIDVGYRWTNLGSNHLTQTAGQKYVSRLGFRGIEDLGDGYKAGFVFETGFNTDEGTNNQTGETGGLQTFVSLGHKDLGEVRFGRQFTFLDAQVYLFSALETSAYAYGSGGFTLNGNHSRMNNAATYIAPKYAGWTLAVQIATEENNSNGALSMRPRDRVPGKERPHYAAAARYDHGPLSVGVTLSQNYGTDTNLDRNNKLLTQIGATYDLGNVKLFAQYEHDGTKADYGVAGSSSYGKKNSALLGLTMPLGPWLLRVGAGWSENANRFAANTVSGRLRQLAFAGDYRLSKRTSWYLAAGWLKGDFGAQGSAEAENSARALSTGIVHLF